MVINRLSLNTVSIQSSLDTGKSRYTRLLLPKWVVGEKAFHQSWRDGDYGVWPGTAMPAHATRELRCGGMQACAAGEPISLGLKHLLVVGVIIKKIKKTNDVYSDIFQDVRIDVVQDSINKR
jgi:hypothetical protein